MLVSDALSSCLPSHPSSLPQSSNAFSLEPNDCTFQSINPMLRTRPGITKFGGGWRALPFPPHPARPFRFLDYRLLLNSMTYDVEQCCDGMEEA